MISMMTYISLLQVLEIPHITLQPIEDRIFIIIFSKPLFVEESSTTRMKVNYKFKIKTRLLLETN